MLISTLLVVVENKKRIHLQQQDTLVLVELVDHRVICIIKPMAELVALAVLLTTQEETKAAPYTTNNNNYN